MDFKQAEKRINEIKQKLNKWREAYYVFDKPVVDDSAYDESYRELLRLEEQFPELVTSDSPTQEVGDKTSSTFEKIKHDIAMLSLDNAFNDEDLLKFNNQITKATNKEMEYTVEPKLDGISISLKYANGKFLRAVTRGDGQTGEDVTESMRGIKGVPATISNKNNIEVRGEAFISHKNFISLNKKREKDGEELFANPRNTAAGSVRQLDSSVANSRGVEVIAYWAANSDTKDYVFETQWKTINGLDKLGFQKSNLSKKAKNIDEVIYLINDFTKNRNNYDYEIDGVVIKVDDTNSYETIGDTSKFPKWAIAYKFPAEVKETKLLDIFPTVGRTGRITYNAKLEEVELAGTKVTAATLHNAEYIIDLDLRIGDIVRVKKAGEIIPKVVSSNKELRKEKLNKWTPETHCQTCGKPLLRKEGEVDQYCVNESCPSRTEESIIHFVSRDAMNIDGLSVKQIEKFINLGWIKDVADIYTLDKYKEDFYELEGYQEKSINSLFESIEKSKDSSLARLLFGLGIRHIGKKSAKDLAKAYQSVENLMNADLEDLLNKNDLGEVKSKSIINYFQDKENILLINKLLTNGVNPKQEMKTIDKNSKLFGKTIVVTGTIAGGTRDEVKEFFESKGAKVTSSLSSKTDYLISGKNPSENKVKNIEKSKIIVIVDINDYKE